MNKQKFLKELEKRLLILNETERQDTINEYRDIIEEKVKHGKTEEEAVKEFGDMNSLSEEILKSYKINPEYKKENRDFFEDCETWIKKGAQKLSEVTEEVIDQVKTSDHDITLEMVFEIIIKICILLVGIAVIHLPFWIIGELGQEFFEHNFFFFGNIMIFNHSVFGILWKVLTEIAYVIVCILLVIAVLKKDTITKPREETKKNTKKQVKEEKIKEEKVVKKVEKNQEKKHTPSRVSEVLIMLLKLWIVFLFIFPLMIIEGAILVILCVLIYFLIKGVELYAPILLVLGMIFFLGHFIKILMDALFTKRKIYFSPFIFSFIMIVLGGIFTLDYLFSFTYQEKVPSKYHLTQYEEEIRLEKPVNLSYDELKIDEGLSDGEVKVIVSYYDQFVKVKKEEETESSCEIDSCLDENYLYYSPQRLESYRLNTLIEDIIIASLKEKDFSLS